jgi:tRNA (pseudouridine54-N1)-methyltransferase
VDWLQRNFIVRARRGPTGPGFSPDALPEANHLEAVTQAVLSALFRATTHRADTAIHVVLEGAPDPPRTLRFGGDDLGSLVGLDERSIAEATREALRASVGIGNDEERTSSHGVVITRTSFDSLIKQACELDGFYYLHRRGEDIRDVVPQTPAVFVLSDHLAMPKKSEHYMKRLGATPLSVGPKLLFAAQCIVLIHNELDR